MPYKRRLDKTRDPVVTPRMVALFDQMKRATGKRWDDLHGDLFDLFNEALSPHPRPWQWPVIQSPREAAEKGERPEALELWRALDQASREARREQRAARRAKANGTSDQPPAA